MTVGSLDPEQLFYLSSRGISNNEAKKMLIAAFSEIVFENLDVSFKKMHRNLWWIIMEHIKLNPKTSFKILLQIFLFYRTII